MSKKDRVRVVKKMLVDIYPPPVLCKKEAQWLPSIIWSGPRIISKGDVLRGEVVLGYHGPSGSWQLEKLAPIVYQVPDGCKAVVVWPESCQNCYPMPLMEDTLLATLEIQRLRRDGSLEIVSTATAEFYVASNPGEQPYVKPGDKVEKGETLCILLISKNVNYFTSEVRGIITEVVAKNGSVVKEGDVLFMYKPL